MVLMFSMILPHVITQSSFSENYNLDDTGSSLFTFPSSINLKLDIYAAPKMVQKVITTPDLSKASGLNCTPSEFLDNCEPELS